ncbi:MAG: hypothetical protein RRZ83_04070 [Alistipes sp.]
MKKILSIVVVLAAVTMVSCCGNAKTAEAAETETVATEVVCEPTDSCCAAQADSTVAVEAAPATEAVVK